MDRHHYRAYCVNSQTASKLLNAKLENSPEFAAKVAELEANPVCARLRLKDFIVKPYQRLTKYPLLFGDIHKAFQSYDLSPPKKGDDPVPRLTEDEHKAGGTTLQCDVSF